MLRMALGALALTSQSLADVDDVPDSPDGLPRVSAPAHAPGPAAGDGPVVAFTPDELLDLVRSGQQYIVLKDHIDMSASSDAEGHSVDTLLSAPGSVAIMVRPRVRVQHAQLHVVPSKTDLHR